MRRLFAVAALAALPGLAQATEWSPQSRRWDGLFTLASEADAQGCRVEARSKLDLSTLRPDDALWILHPTGKLPVNDLLGFVERGGALVVADDFGEARPLFSRFGLDRVAITSGQHFDGNPNLPIAQPTGLGRLTGSDALVADHASALVGSLPATYQFGPRQGLVHEALVGEGMAILISDSSLFINNLLELDGNLGFAQRLVRATCSERGKRLLLVTEDATYTGKVAGPVAPTQPLETRVRAIADQLNQRAAAFGSALAPVDPRMLTLLAVALCLFGAAGLANLVSRRARFDRDFFRAALTPAELDSAVPLLMRRLEEWWSERRGRLLPGVERRAARLADELEHALGHGITDAELARLYREFTQLLAEPKATSEPNPTHATP